MFSECREWVHWEKMGWRLIITPENVRKPDISDVLSGHRNETLAWNW